MGSIAPPETSSPTPLTSALDIAIKRYTEINLLSLKSHGKATLSLPGGNTRTVLHTTPFPLTIQSATGPTLTTLDGYTLIDFLNEYTAGIYGHSHPLIRSAIAKALDSGWNYGAHSTVEAAFAQSICDRFPAIERVRFVNSGTEANMMALATALAVAKDEGYEGKTKVLVFEKGYHGSTISGRAPSHKLSINLPHDLIVGKYNDVEGAQKLLAGLPPDSLAAILLEPMLGSGGGYAATQDFMTTLRELATQHGALLIVDEVMTSRLAPGGMHSNYGIKPDLVTLGKYLGGGMSFGAFGGREDIMALYDPRRGILEHPGTFNNNVFSMHAGIAGAAILTPSKLRELNELGDDLRTKMEGVLHQHNLLKDSTVPDAPVTDERMHDASHPARPPKMYVKGVGSILCIHFAGPEREVLQGLFWHHLLENKIYIAQRGFIALSIENTSAHVDSFIAAVDSFTQQWENSLRWP